MTSGSSRTVRAIPDSLAALAVDFRAAPDIPQRGARRTRRLNLGGQQRLLFHLYLGALAFVHPLAIMQLG